MNVMTYDLVNPVRLREETKFLVTLSHELKLSSARLISGLSPLVSGLSSSRQLKPSLPCARFAGGRSRRNRIWSLGWWWSSSSCFLRALSRTWSRSLPSLRYSSPVAEATDPGGLVFVVGLLASSLAVSFSLVIRFSFAVSSLRPTGFDSRSHAISPSSVDISITALLAVICHFLHPELRMSSLSSAVRDLQRELENKTNDLSKLQKDIAKNHQVRKKYTVQLGENELVLKELDLLNEDANVYKLIGPVLVKQDLAEANSNVRKRIEYITAELKRLDATVQDLEEKQNSKKDAILKLQQRIQSLQTSKAKA
ncbi:hypothetical protein Ahy_A09g045728 isoform A [Arachis hypogaea]|uniref:Prefoldin subunit n=1 Tax=Arachis hypogaea TaxID=3818 RepID=A0A445BN30_ARAHY|nr:hypothetical protein Ahy_A09g045728 isoform A [Arachis hypogaea]